MSLTTLANVFAKLTSIANLSVQLVNVTHSKPGNVKKSAVGKHPK